MSAPLRLLIVTDAFPPVSGGSGWSTYELARGLHARGHHVDVVRVEASKRHGIFETAYSGLRVTEFCRPATSIPVVRNLQKNERLWAQLERYLRARLADGGYDVVHGQHAMSLLVKPYLEQIDFGGDNVATRWWPMGRLGGVVIDPLFAFGAPIVEEIGIRTRTLANSYQAELPTYGEKAVEHVAWTYEISPRHVETALAFQQWLTPA